MNLFDAVILGGVQGLTEFLPVSSSGHLVLFQTLLGLKESMLVFDIAVHWGTLAAVFVFFKKDILLLISESLGFMQGLALGAGKPSALFEKYPYARVSFLIVLGTVPAVFAGVFLKDYFETHFHHLGLVAGAWIVTALLLYQTRRTFTIRMESLAALTLPAVVIIGVAQAIAITPGISRSGITIVTAIFLGLQREQAARFSFLLGIPAILGAGILNLKEGIEFFGEYPFELMTGFLTSALVGYFAILFLLKIIRKDKFYLFSYYCGALGLLSAAYLVFFVR